MTTVERRTVQVIFKTTPSEKKTLAEAPALTGLKWSAWARGVLLAEVARLKAKREEEQK